MEAGTETMLREFTRREGSFDKMRVRRNHTNNGLCSCRL